ncbi:cryptochrome/photolyase family protein [Pontibacter sp. JAM-7]|uniref:cryptochrome/photolyase family protein n=1 Tax=Pontibacter sp. JAM-7 TaxID=3366581 RepID=UPI003AF818FA
MNLVWFRNDLRVRDNPALYQACESGRGVVAVCVLTPGQWQAHDDAPAKMQFWYAHLQSLQAELSALNIPLRLLQADDYTAIPELLVNLATELQSDRLYLNHEYAFNERQRDLAVLERLRRTGRKVVGFHADLIIPPGEVLTGQGQPFKVFTPFSRAWRKVCQMQQPQPLGLPRRQPANSLTSTDLAEQLEYGGTLSSRWRQQLWPAGSDVAHERLQAFVDAQLHGYPQQRDIPSLPGTSQLSPYLTVGAISARQCLAGLSAYADDPDWFNSQWLTELIWREFYRHLLVQFPRMNYLHPFRPEVETRISWHHDPGLFDAWCAGETGFPLVDAGMKQLLDTGWMHNRLRMVCASFLTKLLRQDWRKGAQFFMQHLIDGDFASNMGGWQWCASVGADAAPYFRIFNPQRQAERFDPEGRFVSHWLPELQGLPAKKRHDPAAAAEAGRPRPVIDYRAARQQSLDDYQQSQT